MDGIFRVGFRNKMENNAISIYRKPENKEELQNLVKEIDRCFLNKDLEGMYTNAMCLVPNLLLDKGE